MYEKPFRVRLLVANRTGVCIRHNTKDAINETFNKLKLNFVFLKNKIGENIRMVGIEKLPTLIIGKKVRRKKKASNSIMLFLLEFFDKTSLG